MLSSGIHVSFNPVEDFVPRIPENRCERENDTIPRICVGPTIQKCLSAIPKAGEVIEKCLEAGFPLVINAYYLTATADGFLGNVEAYVPDADATGEMWLTRPPVKVYRKDYTILDAKFDHYTDRFGEEMCYAKELSFCQCRRIDNWEILFRDAAGRTKVPAWIYDRDFKGFILALETDELKGLLA